jgi:hypothetical protein
MKTGYLPARLSTYYIKDGIRDELVQLPASHNPF